MDDHEISSLRPPRVDTLKLQDHIMSYVGVAVARMTRSFTIDMVEI